MNTLNHLNIEILRDCTYFPINDFNIHDRTFVGGVIDASGEFCKLSKQIKGGYTNIPPLPNYTSSDELPGHHLFGGMLQNRHFGHFLIESLCRLWATQFFTNITSVVFSLRSPEAKVAPFVYDILNRLVPNVDFTIVHKPTKIENLVVPTAMCHPNQGILLNDSYCAPLLKKLVGGITTAPEDKFPQKVYVSRSKLNPSHGLLVGEKKLEGLLQEQGYTIIHPETLSINEQLAYYVNADKIIFADGSAFHLFVLVCRPSQKVFIVWRRKKHGNFDLQLRSFIGESAIGQPCLLGSYNPVGASNNSARQKTILDLVSLCKQLKDANFIANTKWQKLSQMEIKKDINALEAKEGKTYEYSNNII